MLAEFAIDRKYVLGTILNSTGHISFPDSEWLVIVKGNSADRNKVITSQFSVSHECQHAESIGEGVQLLFGSSTLTNTVTNQAEWITAWTRTAEATVFVFSHSGGRDRECVWVGGGVDADPTGAGARRGLLRWIPR